MHYYKRDIAQYLKSTAHLTLIEHGVYTRLKDAYMTHEQPLCEKDKYRVIGARSKSEKNAVDTVLNEFFTRSDDRYINAEWDKEIAKYQARKLTNQANGRKPKGAINDQKVSSIY